MVFAGVRIAMNWAAMRGSVGMNRFQRPEADSGDRRTTALELFYDLVFVFAVTQVSYVLLSDLTWSGAGQALLVLLVVWWAWTYTTWATNELDTDSTPVRLCCSRSCSRAF